jgi:uncharacterized protein YyaL (SSP411 family)
VSQPSSPDRSHVSSNRLARETSPYLLQHQHNPVDWYAWGPEAFERARRENRPIFLSVGYSTCYWCHVMERQSFENEAVAAVMNEKFVNIKVDREERPDVDQLYMTAVQLLTRHGGWPMSVWLTPDLRPFYGGTYFPPTDQYGRPGFVTLLHALDDAYRNRRAEVDRTADQITNVLRNVAEPDAPERPLKIDNAFVDELIQRSVSDYDPIHGGFGGAPKFPRETLLELLLVYLRDASPADPKSQISDSKTEISNLRSEVRRRLLHTLDALAAGGIRDHLGGGFHRYSTDAKWLVPHFEIMLYDNGMLTWCYAEAFRQTGEARYAAVARGICDFVLREMTSPEGAFYTALDAEVDGQEGLNYLWTADEIASILGPDDAPLFNRVYGLDLGPNFADPHHGTGVPDKNILFLPRPIESAEVEARLAPMRQKLKAARDQRKQPLLDTKILTSWNALMTRALAHAGDVLKEPRYLDAARRALRFLLEQHRTADGGLYRTSREGRRQYDGFLDDYAYTLAAAQAVNAAAADAQMSDVGQQLAREIKSRFGDESGAGGFYFTDRRSTDLIVRQKVAGDSPLPSGNAVAAIALLELGDARSALGTIAAFAQQLRHNGEGMGAMVQAALLYLRKTGEPFTVSADTGGAAAGAERPASPQESAAAAVDLDALWQSPTELQVQLSIAPGYHINHHEPATAGDVPLVATRLSVESPAGVTVGAMLYPQPVERTLPFADAPLLMYEGDVTIVVRFASAPPEGSELTFALTYQACDDAACLPPVTKRFRLASR